MKRVFLMVILLLIVASVFASGFEMAPILDFAYKPYDQHAVYNEYGNTYFEYLNSFELLIGIEAQYLFTDSLLIYTNGYANTWMLKNEDDIGFWPYNQAYAIQIGVSWAFITFYFEHMCKHPVVCWEKANFETEDASYNRFSLRIGGLKNINSNYSFKF